MRIITQKERRDVALFLHELHEHDGEDAKLRTDEEIELILDSVVFTHWALRRELLKLLELTIELVIIYYKEIILFIFMAIILLKLVEKALIN